MTRIKLFLRFVGPSISQSLAPDPQGLMFSYFSPESRVPVDHPLRSTITHTSLTRSAWPRTTADRSEDSAIERALADH